MGQKECCSKELKNDPRQRFRLKKKPKMCYIIKYTRTVFLVKIQKKIA